MKNATKNVKSVENPTIKEKYSGLGKSGLEIKLNRFGEVISSLEIDNINDFLNKNLEDKKLISREKSN
ncbi:MAG: hypothetical protein R2784_01105 [Saprospiraceae bacterium]